MNEPMNKCYAVYEKHRYEISTCELDYPHERHYDPDTNTIWSDGDPEILCRKCGSKMKLIEGFDVCVGCGNREEV